MSRKNRGIVYYTVLWAFVFVLGAERFYQWRHSISYTTGFYLTGSIKSQYAFAITFAAAIALQLLFAFREYKGLKKRSCVYESTEVIRTKSGLFTGLLQLGIGILLLSSGINGFAGAYSSNSWDILEMCEDLFALLSAVIFLWACVDNFLKRPVTSKTGYSFIICTLWLGFRAAAIFKDFTTVTTLSQQFISLMAVLSTLLFITNYARLFSGLEKASTKAKLAVTGAVTAMFSLTATVPVYAAKFYDERLPVDGLLVGAADVLIGLFALVTLAKLMISRNDGAVPDEKNN